MQRNYLSRVAWLLLGRWSYNAITLVSFAVIARLISADELGAYMLASVFLIFFDTFFSDAVENAIIVQVGEEAKVSHTAFWLVVGFASVLGALIWLGAGVYASLYDHPSVELAVKSLALFGVIQAAACVPRALLMKRMQARQLAMIVTAANMAGATCGIAMALRGSGIGSLIAQQAVIQVAVFAFASWSTRFVPRLRFDLSIAREMFRYVWLNFWSVLANIASNRLDLIVVGMFAGAASAGIYGLAKRLTQILHDLVSSSFDKMFIAFRSSNESSSGREALSAVMTTQAVVLLPAFVGFALTSPLIVPVLFGPQWTGTGELIILMTVGGIFRALVTVARADQYAAGQAGRMLIVRLAELALTAGVLLPFSHMGIAYIAVMYSVTKVVGYFLVLVSRASTPSELVDHLRISARSLVFPLAGVCLMAPAAWLVMTYSLPVLGAVVTVAIAVLVGVLIYGAVMYALRRFWWPFRFA